MQNLQLGILLLGLASVPAFLLWWTIQKDRDGQWHPIQVFRARRLIDGSMSSGRLARRYHRGQWQYREMSNDELISNM